MGFTPVKNVRISSLPDGALVQLRLGKAAVRSEKDDITIVAKKLSSLTEGEKSLMVFEEHGDDGKISETVISKFPGAAWRCGQFYVSLRAVDEDTVSLQKPPSPIQTDVITDAVKWVHAVYEDVFAPEQLVALLTYIQNGKRINTEVKALAIQYAHKLVQELSSVAATEEQQQG